MQEYTLGLVFNIDLSEILLITRGTHAFHTNKTNALGGKIIIGESPIECVRREIFEESGIKTSDKDWQFMGIINGNTWKVWVFSAKIAQVEPVKATDEGTLSWTNTHQLPENTVRNLQWIIPFCKDKWNDPEVQSFVVWYATKPEQK